MCPSYTSSQSANLQAVNEQKILSAANKLFLKKGYFNVNIAKIAREAGVSKGTIYNYFQGKDDILKTLIVNHFSSVDSLKIELKGKAMIKEYIDSSINSLESHCNFLRVVYPLVFFTHSFNYLKDFLLDVTKKQVKSLTKAFDETGAEHPFGEAALLVTEIDGMNLHYMSVKEKYPLHLFKNILYNRYGFS